MTFDYLETEANNSISSADEISALSTYNGSLSSSSDEDYGPDIIINVKSGTGQVLDYKLDLRHANYDVDGDGVTSEATEGLILQAYLACASPSDVLPLISATSPIETADDLLIQLLDIA